MGIGEQKAHVLLRASDIRPSDVVQQDLVDVVAVPDSHRNVNSPLLIIKINDFSWLIDFKDFESGQLKHEKYVD